MWAQQRGKLRELSVEFATRIKWDGDVVLWAVVSRKNGLTEPDTWGHSFAEPPRVVESVAAGADRRSGRLVHQVG